MQIKTRQVEVHKTYNNDEIEKELFIYGEPLRWAIVEVKKNSFIIDGVFIKNV